MSDQNIIPSAPHLIYPQLAEVIPGDAYEKFVDNNFRFKKISDCQTEIKNKISHYQKVLKKYISKQDLSLITVLLLSA